ncbi:hypothetical protein DCO58_09475 [Helicobacter saguini]|uniref:Lipopolysaccharide heptosyltransferase family protein n=1 Tax=Helicobacter saguini TaxID=1548018 RepID=A0A347VP97_9HELI|nr:glycosyltransferase family 9 protein [Helicobacter saguini]MWV61453.1 hypothetical protein [Helicobacter saguini]MWV67876.1 hypothetical protein [Helicobacter saguini]MWV70655.1 hypothetical protein [Helicobacter saguini]TLD94704.1 lipopolysaccharide heptosyltransferase family protein [Helicobacter saguini]
MWILIRLPNWLGDCIMFSPTLDFLHRQFPQAKFVLVGNKLTANVFKENDFIVKIFTDNTKELANRKDSIESNSQRETKNIDSKITQNLDSKNQMPTHHPIKKTSKKPNFFVKIFKRFKATKNLAYEINLFLKENKISQFDYAITTQNNFFSAYFLSKIYAKYTIGFSDKHFFGVRNFLLSTLVKYKNHHSPIATHQVLSYINLTLPLLKVSDFETFIAKNGGNAFLQNYINSTRYNKNASLTQNLLYLQARDLTLFKEDSKKPNFKREKVIAFCTGASFGESKMWLLQYFVETIIALLKKGYKVRIFGSPAEVERNATISQNVLNIVGNEYDKMLQDLSGRTSIAELIESMSECALYIGNDSGVTHIARALNIPSIIIFGPMPFSWCSPWVAIDLDSIKTQSVVTNETSTLDSKITNPHVIASVSEAIHKTQNLDSNNIAESNDKDSKKTYPPLPCGEDTTFSPPPLRRGVGGWVKKGWVKKGWVKNHDNPKKDSIKNTESNNNKKDFILNGVIKKGEYYYIANCIAVQKDLPCVPCKKKTCPLKHHNCMRLITPDEILNLIHSHLQKQ